MSDTNFVNGTTLSDADWFNDLNRLHYTIFGDPTTGAAAMGTVINALTADGSPVPSTDYVVTYDASANTGKKVLLRLLSSAPKIITSTRAHDAASGNVAYTGVGFTPRAVVAFAAVGATREMSIGCMAAGSNVVMYDASASPGTYGISTTAAFIFLDEDTGKNQGAVLSTFDSDGFTLTWTRTGATNSATITLLFLCFP